MASKKSSATTIKDSGDSTEETLQEIEQSITAPLPEVRGDNVPEPDVREEDPYLLTYIAPDWLQSPLYLHRLGEDGSPQNPALVYEGIQFFPNHVQLTTVTNLQRQGVITVEKLSDWLRLTQIRKVQSLEKGFTLDLARFLIDRELVNKDLADFMRRAVRQYNGIEL